MGLHTYAVVTEVYYYITDSFSCMVVIDHLFPTLKHEPRDLQNRETGEIRLALASSRYRSEELLAFSFNAFVSLTSQEQRRRKSTCGAGCTGRGQRAMISGSDWFKHKRRTATGTVYVPDYSSYKSSRYSHRSTFATSLHILKKSKNMSSTSIVFFGHSKVNNRDADVLRSAVHFQTLFE
jgi:hypothetical protein